MFEVDSFYLVYIAFCLRAYLLFQGGHGHGRSILFLFLDSAYIPASALGVIAIGDLDIITVNCIYQGISSKLFEIIL